MKKYCLQNQLILLLMALLVSACTLPGNTPPTGQPVSVDATIAYLEGQLDAGVSVPVVAISSPSAGQAFAFNQEIEVVSGSVDKRGIIRVELLVDGRVVASNQLSPQPDTEFVIKQRWLSDKPGKYTLQVQAYNPDNKIGQSSQILVQILAPPSPTDTGLAQASPTSTASPTPLPSLTPTARRNTSTPESIPLPAAATATSTPTEPYLIVNVQSGLNVRQGPSTGYAIIGRLNSGDRVTILGQNNIGAGRWWQINYPRATNNVGWISASSDYSAAYNTGDVAIAAVPSTPTAASSTATVTSTPVPTAQQTNLDFGVDRTNIQAGECVTFFWNINNVKEIYFRGQGVSGGSQARQECPTQSEDFELRVVRLDGSINSRNIRIDVQGDPYRALIMSLGDHVDFDRDGHVNDDDNGNNDFEWIESSGERRFQIWRDGDDDDDGVRLAPVGPEGLHVIRREDCDFAVNNLQVSRFIEPFNGLAACFTTDSGRLGKLLFVDSDDKADIRWSIWP